MLGPSLMRSSISISIYNDIDRHSPLLPFLSLARPKNRMLNHVVIILRDSSYIFIRDIGILFSLLLILAFICVIIYTDKYVFFMYSRNLEISFYSLVYLESSRIPLSIQFPRGDRIDLYIRDEKAEKRGEDGRDCMTN